MKLKTLVLVIVGLYCATANAQRGKTNIINYFASNNQIIGVPMVDMQNAFRFYPDLNLQKAIVGVEVYYFVQNDVYKHHLAWREDKRYWETVLRDFTLGESIQRVEVVVDCNVDSLKVSLSHFGLNIKRERDLNHFLLLRRGDDKGMAKMKIYEELLAKSNTEFDVIKNQLEELVGSVAGAKNQFGLMNIYLDKLIVEANKIGSFQKKVDEAISLLRSARSNLPENFAIAKTQIDKANAIIKEFDQEKDQLKVSVENFDKNLKDSINDKIQGQMNSFESLMANYEIQKVDIQNKLKEYSYALGDLQPISISQNGSQFDKELDLLKEVSKDPNNRLYSAYVENRLTSMLDMRYKDDKKKEVIQFVYRNDKLSLQYLQADDPQEKLGIFRARLVPFAFYRRSEANGELGDFKWHNDQIIYEIGINFGYAIVKGDHFTPRLFDMNRLGLGLGITSDTFSKDPSFLSLALTYDMNTYTSIGFGANLIDKPAFYIGVGINARAFKDLVKNSGTLFSGRD